MNDIEIQRSDADHQNDGQYGVGQGHQLHHISMVGPVLPGANSLVDGDHHVSTIEGEERKKIEDSYEDVDQEQQLQDRAKTGSNGVVREVDDTDR